MSQRNQMILWRELRRQLASKASPGDYPKVVVVDRQSDVGLALRAVEVALATAKATERRAATLLALAKSSPELLLKARGIYIRAGRRVSLLQKTLERATSCLTVGEERS